MKYVNVIDDRLCFIKLKEGNTVKPTAHTVVFN